MHSSLSIPDIRQHMSFPTRRIPVTRRLSIIGTGCVTRGFLPLLFRHLDVPPSSVTLVGPDESGHGLAQQHGVEFVQRALTPDNHASLLGSVLGAGDFLINLALGVGSLDLLAWCQQRGVLYLDTNLEPWGDAFHAMHEARSAALHMRRPGTCTAVIAHGANPGLASHFLKQALSELAFATACRHTGPGARADWSALARELGVRTVAVTELDSQTSPDRRHDDVFCNTWSARGLTDELRQPSELYWGGHETQLPPHARLVGDRAGRVALLSQPAGTVAVRSWTPGCGAMTGYLLAHHESISLGTLLARADGAGGPTVFYAYRPCPAARRSALALRARDWIPHDAMHVMGGELSAGGNELGVLVLGRKFGYWYGSRLGLFPARTLAPDNSATSLQVVAGVLAGVIWALENPAAGIVEAEDMDFRRVLELASPYLGQLEGLFTDWRPASDAPDGTDLAFARFLVSSPPNGG